MALTKQQKLQAGQVADGLNEWVGLEFEMNRPMVESLAWAFAQNENLKHAFDALVAAERQALVNRMTADRILSRGK